MTIRYVCDKCGSVLKIKDALAGTDGRCPKCKSEFVVPQAGAASATASGGTEAPGAPEDAEFDPVAFLMAGEAKPSGKAPAKQAKPAAVPAEPDMRVSRQSAAAAYTASDEPDVRVGRPSVADGTVDEDELELQTRQRKAKRAPAVPSAAQSADEMLRVDASTNAKELLTKTMEESRIRAAQMPQEKTEPGVDYKEVARELGLRVVPLALGAVVLVVLTYKFADYMAGGGPKLPEGVTLGRVSGTVTKAGVPLVGAQVTFIPVDQRASAATGVTDEKGSYRLSYMEGMAGAVVGKNRVEVSCIGPNGREQVPPRTKYGFGSNEVHTVTEGSQIIDIEIP